MVSPTKVVVEDYGSALEILLFDAITEIRASNARCQDVFGLDSIVSYTSFEESKNGMGYVAVDLGTTDFEQLNIDRDPESFMYALLGPPCRSKTSRAPNLPSRHSSSSCDNRSVPKEDEEDNDVTEDDTGLGPSRK
jgi:hypothetical protein